MPSAKDDDRWERWVKDALRTRHLHEPGRAALSKALALGGHLESSRGGAANWLATLLFDSASQPLPAGVRGVSAGNRRLLYEACVEGNQEKHCQLDLQIRRDPAGTIEVTGQLLPPWGPARVEATTGKTRRTKTLGESGEFLLRRIPSRARELRLEIRTEAGQSLVVPVIPLLLDDPESS